MLLMLCEPNHHCGFPKKCQCTDPAAEDLDVSIDVNHKVSLSIGCCRFAGFTARVVLGWSYRDIHLFD